MRENRTVQASIFEQYAEHEIGLESKAMSDWLDQNVAHRSMDSPADRGGVSI